MSPNLNAFLDMIAVSEGTSSFPDSDDGYRVIVGSVPGRVDLFDDYSDHPHKLVVLTIHGKQVKSTAAGRYQILGRYFDVYKVQLNLPDFGPHSQDLIAVQMIRECHALDDIEAGNIAEAARKCASRWASLPGAGYDQHENAIDGLLSAYLDAGGTMA